ncbi:MAG: hypothetical protein IJA75_03215 [Oscillospiraceae bacterium]|nr:hypothetical protein [Oscillospiraceae bacterium]
MPKNPKMTLTEVLQDLRQHGVPMGAPALSHCMETGVFPFAHVLGKGPTGRTYFLIMRKDYEEWAKEYLAPYVNS